VIIPKVICGGVGPAFAAPIIARNHSLVSLFERERTAHLVRLRAVHMYLQGLSLPISSACLEDVCPRIYVSARRWVQRFNHLNNFFRADRSRCFLVN
jgi:hypothetical protein